MPRDKALAEIKIASVFIALASGLQYHRLVFHLLEIQFSLFCASKYFKPRVPVGGHLRAWPGCDPSPWLAGGNAPVVSH
jgi:hypothetical protein